ncbi:MAG: TonB-dependent receptor [Desulfobacteraceae bacterium]|nr:TonB-dependent receptor [Desulfobacteraceae bacterium]MBC2756521.1 TonB-dependent receptor [Desulfobacteraceae bacterium]
MMKKKIFIKIFVFAASLFLLLHPIFLFAQDNEISDEEEENPVQFELDAIVVTANKVQEPISDIPKHVTVISSEDIKESTAKNIIELLAQEAGVNVRTTFGNDKQAVVDLRGMGDTAASNVIVMVDNLMLNAADQSGPSISSVPIEEIERIEIVRGAGSVVYGNGAVGGVINIITKKAGKTSSIDLYSSYGSYNTFDLRGSLNGNIKDLYLNLNAGLHDSDGYRDNGFFRKKDISAKSSYAINDRFSFLLSGFYYEDEYGLPGPISKEDINSGSRRVLTDRPDDSGETSEARGRFEFDMDFEKWGTLNLIRGYHLRDNRYIIGFNPQIPRSDQKDKIDEDTRQFDLNYVKNYTSGGQTQMVQLGIDHYITDYIREEKPDGPRKNSETESFGIFINNRWSLTDSLMLSARARYNNFQGYFRTDEKKLFDDVKIWVNGDTTMSEWDNSAYSIGFTYSMSPKTSFFSSYATSFRIPNVDEFAECEEGLQPQEGVNIEIGGRWQFGSFMSMTVTLFDIRIEDEIYYSDINRNYEDKTIRQGIETDFTLYTTEDIRMWGSYAFTKAEFDKKNTTIPLVPEHRVSAGMHWQIISQLALSLSGVYTGSRFDGNDTNNDRYEKLDEYIVFDSKLTYEYKSLMIFAGINNIFNELYSTTAYNEQYYPMPGRTIYGGIRWTYY